MNTKVLYLLQVYIVCVFHRKDVVYLVTDFQFAL